MIVWCWDDQVAPSHFSRQVALVRAMQNAVQDSNSRGCHLGLSKRVGLAKRSANFHGKSWESAVLKILSQQMLGYCTPHLHVQSIWSNIHIYCNIDCFCQHAILDFVKKSLIALVILTRIWRVESRTCTIPVQQQLPGHLNSYRRESTIIIFGHILTTL